MGRLQDSDFILFLKYTVYTYVLSCESNNLENIIIIILLLLTLFYIIKI